ncbi:MAG: hypothetical protein H6Q90_6280, partial [Deltaproteobacteria bacterium]|nr:hypothetical protein [Deltaproteobacteria bacterium]
MTRAYRPGWAGLRIILREVVSPPHGSRRKPALAPGLLTGSAVTTIRTWTVLVRERVLQRRLEMRQGRGYFP